MEQDRKEEENFNLCIHSQGAHVSRVVNHMLLRVLDAMLVFIIYFSFHNVKSQKLKYYEEKQRTWVVSHSTKSITIPLKLS